MWSCVFTGEKKEEGLHSTACSNGTTMERGSQEKKTKKQERMGVDEGTWKDDLKDLFIYLSELQENKRRKIDDSSAPPVADLRNSY